MSMVQITFEYSLLICEFRWDVRKLLDCELFCGIRTPMNGLSFRVPGAGVVFNVL